MADEEYDAWDESPFSVVRDGYRFRVNWASKGMPLYAFDRAGSFAELVFNSIVNSLDEALAHRQPIKVGVVCRRVVGWKPSVPRVIYKEWIPGVGNYELVEQRMDELLALAKDGYFDHLKPGKS